MNEKGRPCEPDDLMIVRLAWSLIIFLRGENEKALFLRGRPAFLVPYKALLNMGQTNSQEP